MKTINLASIHNDVTIVFGEFPIYTINGVEFSLVPCGYTRGLCQPTQFDFYVSIKGDFFENVKFDTWRKVSNKMKQFIGSKLNKIIKYTEDISCYCNSFEISVSFRDIILSKEHNEI